MSADGGARAGLSSDADTSRLEWFALRVKPRHERASAAFLRSKGFDDFVPFYRARHSWSDRVKELDLPLFAGYVFCRFEPRHRLQVVTTPGVSYIVGVGRTPVPVSDSELAAIRTIANSGVKAEPSEFIELGCRIRLGEGPLCGVEGVLVERKQRQRLIVSVSLLRRSVSIEIDEGWIRRAG